MTHVNTNSFAIEKKPLRITHRAFFSVSAVASFLFAVFNSIDAITYFRRGMPNDHLAAFSYGSIAIGLTLVCVAAVLLATGHANFRPSSSETSLSKRVARFTAFAIVVVIACLGGLLAIAGALQGILLTIGSVTWFVAFFYERNRHDQNIFRGTRWLIRLVATAIGLVILVGGMTNLLDAANLYNKLYLHWSILNLPRMSANIPESDARIHGLLFTGIPFTILGCLLIREVFRRFRLVRKIAPQMQSAPVS